MLESLSPKELEKLEKKLAKITPAEELNLPSGCRRYSEHVRTRNCFDFSRVENAAKQIKRLPQHGETIHCLMGGDYNGSDIIPAIQSLAEVNVDELYIATLGFNKTNTTQLCTMFDDGLLRRVTLLCSHYFSQTDGGTFDFAERELTGRGQRIVFTRNHAKILLFRMGRSFYVVESSANLRSCNNLEQFTLCRSEGLFKFHAGWMERIVAEGCTRP